MSDRRSFVFLALLAVGLLPVSLLAQSAGTITGTVTSSWTGQVLSGVSVSVDGTNLGTLTQSNGRFIILNVPTGNQSIRVSMIGYAEQVVQDIPVTPGQAAIANVEMVPEALALAEVVVVAYGQQQRATMTGAVSSIAGEELARAPVLNLQTSLGGRVSGLVMNTRTGVPGAEETRLRIRGAATLDPPGPRDGIVEPLVVIDGITDRDGGFARLNPNDIQSMTVLKDASAAIYGAQAGAGVILVTTKQGRGPATIQYTGNFGFTRPTFEPDLVDAVGYANYINELLTRLGQSPLYTDEDIQKFRDGSDPLTHPNTDWIDAIVQDGPAPQMDHTLQVSGASDQFRYFVSGRYASQEDIFRKGGFNYEQYDLRSNLSSQLHPNLEVGLRLYGRTEVRDWPNQNPDGIWSQASRNYPTTHAEFPNGFAATGVEFNNPLVMTDGRTGFDNDRDWLGQSTLDFRVDMPWLTRGLYASGTAAFDLRYSDSKNMNLMYDWYDYIPQTDEFVNHRDRTGPMNLSVSNTYNFERTFRTRIGWDRAFGDHSFQTFAAYERFEEDLRGLSGNRQDLPSDQIPELFVGSTEGIDNNSFHVQDARAHYFGRLSYSYADRYLAEFTLRHDGSARFPEAGRWGTFPGASVGWRVSDEGFFPVDWITDLKLKASWGLLGNDETGNFQHLALFNTTQSGAIFGWPGPAPVFGLSPGVSPNPNITWEKVDKKNFGLEATLWDGRLSTDLNYFRDYRSDILMSRGAEVPAYTGLNLPNENLGEVANQGFDGSLRINGDLGNGSWYVASNLTYARSEIVVMNESPDIPDYQKQIGHQVGSWLIFKDCGIFRSQEEIDARPHISGALPGDVCFEDVNDDGEINGLDRIRIYESPDPNLQYGLDLGAALGRFSLGMVWQGQGKSKIVVQPNQINATVTPPKWLFEDRWTPENPDGRWPASFDRRNSRSYANSTFWLRDANFFRLRSAQISFQVPESALESIRVPLDNVTLTLSGYNLLTFSGIENYDPELNRVNTYYYPQQRVFNFGITAGL